MRWDIAGLCFTDGAGVAFDHDLALTALSYFVAVCGSYTSLEMVERWRRSESWRAACWQAAGALVLGGSIWSMHFIASLALRTPFDVTYAPNLTLLSLVIPVLGVAWGLHVVRARATLARIGGAGLIVGLAVAMMHYVGMASMRFPGTLAYTPTLWGVSLLVGIAAAMAALWLSLTLQRRRHRALAALVMGVAICGMHFTGMAATVFTFDPLAPVQPGLNSGLVAAMVCSATLALTLQALAFVAADRRLMASIDREAEVLRRKNAELEIGQSQFDAAIGNMSQGLTFLGRDERLIVCNRRFGEIYGLPAELTQAGVALDDILAHRAANGSFPDMTLAAFKARQAALVGAGDAFDITDELANGRAVTMHHQPLGNGSWVVTHEDITDRRAADANILFMARYDMLTKLPNRQLFQERLAQAIAMVGRGENCAVLCLDLDHFKVVNDTLGHATGDLLLQATADRLQACVREVDTVARLGGDEFAIIQLGVRRAEDVALLTGRLIDAFSSPIELGGHQVLVGLSIGAAVAPMDGSAPEKLLKNADVALYLAKTEGRGTARFFEAGMNARIEQRQMLELDLRQALAHDAFELHYQPLVELDTGRIAQFEALLRWNHPVRGLVSPADFIPLAEETGLIVPIGAWALRTACAEAAGWPDGIRVAVNLSPVQFRSGDLVATVRAALAQSGLAPARLELEITESILLQDSAATLNALVALREMGITVALDDFGTGYSSLSYLKRFPFDKIKIDQSFIRDMAESPDSMSIVRAISGLGKSLNMTTTAEGVETSTQLDRLRSEGCSQAQGYFLSRPKPARELRALITTFPGRAAAPAGQAMDDLVPATPAR